MAGPCVADSSCIRLTVVDDELVAELIVSPDDGNLLECRENGAYINATQPIMDHVTTAASSTFNVTAVSPGEQVVQTASFSVVNPSAANSAFFMVIADLGSADFVGIPAFGLASNLIYTRVLPNAFGLQHRFTATGPGRYEDAGCPQFFFGGLGPAGGGFDTSTVEVQRRVQRNIVTPGPTGTVGRIRWTSIIWPLG